MPGAEAGLAARLLAPAHRVTLEDLPGVWFHTVATVRCQVPGPLAGAGRWCCWRVGSGRCCRCSPSARPATSAATPASAWAATGIGGGVAPRPRGRRRGIWPAASAGIVVAVLLIKRSGPMSASTFWVWRTGSLPVAAPTPACMNLTCGHAGICAAEGRVWERTENAPSAFMVTVRRGPSSAWLEDMACLGTGADTGVCTGARDGADGAGSYSHRPRTAAPVQP